MVKSVSITAYHPEIWVRQKSGEVSQVQLDLGDWFPDDEVRKLLLKAFPGCDSFGDLVTAVKKRNGESPQGVSGMANVCVREDKLECDSDIVHDWDALI